MADEKKGPKKGGAAGGASPDTKTDRRRLGYLKMRGKELKEELQANRTESAALREKLGMGAKAGGGKKKLGAGGGDDEGDDE